MIEKKIKIKVETFESVKSKTVTESRPITLSMSFW